MEYINIATLQTWGITHGIKILAIFVGAYIAHRVGRIFIERLVRKAVHVGAHGSKTAEHQREETIIRIFSGTLKVGVWTLAVLMALSETGFEIGPLLAAAGVAGLAFGFGGQYLIRDIVSGLFIILENQYRIGDVVCFGGTCGKVEDITLRMTTLRDMDGTVHHVPHGEIKTTANKSKGYARINMNISVSYAVDLEKVIVVVNRVGNELAADTVWQEHITKAPQFLRVEEFADSAVMIKIVGETKPSKQWEVAGELRKRIKIAFDKEGIEIPFPQRVIHQAK